MTVIENAQSLWLEGHTIEGLCADGIVTGFEHKANREAVVLHIAGVIDPCAMRFQEIPVGQESFWKAQHASCLSDNDIEALDFFCEVNRYYVPKNVKEQIRLIVFDVEAKDARLSLPQDVVDSIATLILTGEIKKRGRFI